MSVRSSGSKNESGNSCRRCGTCCRRGGPALHTDDAGLIRSGRLRFDDLITIRTGEYAYNPVSDRIEPAAAEMIKINGRDGVWTCRFYQSDTSHCRLYADRPLECRLLKCWAPDELLAVVGRDYLSRGECIQAHDPLRHGLALFERHCPADRTAAAVEAWLADPGDDKLFTALEGLAQTDLAVRHHLFEELGLPAAAEMFLCGRPLFIQLAAFGVVVSETPEGIRLHRPNQGPGG